MAETQYCKIIFLQLKINKFKKLKLKMVLRSYISIITLNVNGLNAPIKRQSLVKQTQKQDPYICCLQGMQLKPRDTYRLKVKGWKEIFHANGDQKKARIAILISDKIDFEVKAMKRDKEGHYIMIKRSIQERDITIINICTQHRSTTICKANANKNERGN